ncbi:NTP transferase domain-containing protein [Lacrimispora algidixylanolytica]|uniref:NTP transferase domain-containing protein n=1 Tax=Lacrimispora algidixylanolytica TaxID=94868 RepID=UPI001A9B00FA|nr:NTP transferase domain-containing protein [Lacrimispora algidixylanolytica]
MMVKGEVLIERQIRQLQEAGIDDITVVVGDMKEKMYYLAEKMGVKIVINEDYYCYNNTSSLIRVADKLGNTYICSSDNYFSENVFTPYVYHSYYAAVFERGETDEYCLKCNSKGRIIQVNIGGRASWYMLGHVYFSQEFSHKFIDIL